MFSIAPSEQFFCPELVPGLLIAFLGQSHSCASPGEKRVPHKTMFLSVCVSVDLHCKTRRLGNSNISCDKCVQRPSRMHHEVGMLIVSDFKKSSTNEAGGKRPRASFGSRFGHHESNEVGPVSSTSSKAFIFLSSKTTRSRLRSVLQESVLNLCDQYLWTPTFVTALLQSK